VLARANAGFRFRVPSWRVAPAASAFAIAKWLVLWAAVEVALSLGRFTPFGTGLLGAVIPLLVLEAWLTTWRHWRARLFDTLAFAVPAGGLLSLFSVMPGSCCFCDQSPWARTQRNLEFVGDFLYFNALATLPALALLVVLRRRSSSPAEDAAYRQATFSALLSTLCSAAAFGGLFHAIVSP
jgi:hypothetical protein